uniref:Uncharacterized protein n=1 Tax=Timema genevievae TaxID=629358 RepID=A0A7R9PLZ6_TIMGE|nr:unnamed protein product [Timema genevievae]
MIVWGPGGPMPNTTWESLIISDITQTNVYPSAQRRKMRGFEGFIRRAVVIVPTDEEFKRRCEQREKVEGKDVPDSAVLEMKDICLVVISPILR